MAIRGVLVECLEVPVYENTRQVFFCFSCTNIDTTKLPPSQLTCKKSFITSTLINIVTYSL